MENREYFFHKRKSMAQRENKDDDMDAEMADQKFEYVPPKPQYQKRPRNP